MSTQLQTVPPNRFVLIDLAGVTLTMEVMRAVLREIWDEGHRPTHTVDSPNTMSFYDAEKRLVGMIKNGRIPTVLIPSPPPPHYKE